MTDQTPRRWWRQWQACPPFWFHHWHTELVTEEGVTAPSASCARERAWSQIVTIGTCCRCGRQYRERF